MTRRRADADADDFARAMSDVVRLSEERRERVHAKPAPHAPRRSGAPPSTRMPGAEADADVPDASFAASGVSRRELATLKRGGHAPGDRLDLHGLMAADAVARVARFIDDARLRHRCVCIVHGRGLHSEGGVAVLRTRVRARLRQHRAVLAYADAPASDGGRGAVYVLLRR